MSVSKGVRKVRGSWECECDLSSSRCLARLHLAIFSEPGARAVGRRGGRSNPKIVVQWCVRAPPSERGREKRVSVGGVKDSRGGQTEQPLKHVSNSDSVAADQPCLLSLNLLLKLKLVLFYLISCSTEEVSICHYRCDFAATGVKQDSVNRVKSFSTMKGTLGI